MPCSPTCSDASNFEHSKIGEGQHSWPITCTPFRQRSGAIVVADEYMVRRGSQRVLSGCRAQAEKGLP